MAKLSITNWSRMSRCRAPTARRTPISRVRSSTVASMMFMIPMPPTSSEMRGDGPHHHVEEALGASALLEQRLGDHQG